MSICPFCEHDPFHYVDNGVGTEAVAVDCCDLGDQFFRGMRPAPESIELPWDEFIDIGGKLANSRATIAALVGALEDIAIYGCGMLNQPAALNGSEEEWLRKRIARYEEVARAALQLARGEKGDE